MTTTTKTAAPAKRKNERNEINWNSLSTFCISILIVFLAVVVVFSKREMVAVKLKSLPMPKLCRKYFLFVLGKVLSPPDDEGHIHSGKNRRIVFNDHSTPFCYPHTFVHRWDDEWDNECVPVYTALIHRQNKFKHLSVLNVRQWKWILVFEYERSPDGIINIIYIWSHLDVLR